MTETLGQPDLATRLAAGIGRVFGFLAKAGFADVCVIQGGMTAWRDRGWPVEHTAGSPAIGEVTDHV